MSEEKKEEIVPLVSVCVITYNHEKYIRQCLDGILMQKVNFPYEILIHDDASPDATADIIREYEAKYPDVIKPIYQTENQYSKVGIGVISRFNDERARGKYIAQCEGDDYWTDSGKLQMQVDFLEAHPEYVETGHNITVINEKGCIPNHPASLAPERVYTIDDLQKGRLWKVATASAVYRNIFQNLDESIRKLYYACPATGDLKISLLLSQYGDCYVFARQMSVYRSITTYGTSFNARAKGKNMSLFWYNAYTGSMQFMKDAFDVEIDFKDLLATSVSMSILFWIKNIHHRKTENYTIMTSLLQDYKKRYGNNILLSELFTQLFVLGSNFIIRRLRFVMK